MSLKSRSRRHEPVIPLARNIFVVGCALTALVVLAATGGPTPEVAAASSTTTTCSRYASPTGSDSWPGTESKPFATVQYLVDHLSAGRRAACSAAPMWEISAPASPV